MTYEQLQDYMTSNATASYSSSEEIIEHFKNTRHYDVASYNNDLLFIFNNVREFHNRNHLIGIHQRMNGAVPMHIYHYVVMTYVYSGTFHMTIEDKHIALHAGDLVIFDRNVPHGVAMTGVNDLGINIILNDSYFTHSFTNVLPPTHILTKFFNELMTRGQSHTHYLIYTPGEDQTIRNTIDNILCEYLDSKALSDQIIDNYIMILLTHLSRINTYQDNIPTNKNHQLIEAIFDYVQNHYQEGSLQDACRNLGYSSSYASKIIKKELGKTFKTLVNEERMKQAMILLHNPDIPIYEIAEKVGITNLTAFYKRFEAYTSYSPLQYRRQNSL